MWDFLRTATHLLAPLTANCADFNEHWTRVRMGPGSMAGPWQGEWTSTRSGHHGSLRSVVELTSDTIWHVRFRAGYAHVLRACYAAEFHVARLADGRWTFSGRSDLGALAGGLYEYSGEATSDTIVCQYISKYDRGEFRLKRA